MVGHPMFVSSGSSRPLCCINAARCTDLNNPSLRCGDGADGFDQPEAEGALNTSTGLDQDGAHAHRKLAPHRLFGAGSRKGGLPCNRQLALLSRSRKLPDF